MRFSEKWLREWVDLAGVSSDDLVHRLTMSGLEVDLVQPAAPDFSGVVVGRIAACEAHPDADKLSLCRVEDGSGKELQVVCGAPNARAGLIAPFARVGAVLPGEFRISKAKLRGVESEGMLCSSPELGIGEDASGLLELPDDAPVGTDLRDYLDLDDRSIEIDLTPNRADCLGMIGLAQEVAAIFGREVRIPEVATIDAACEDTRTIRLQSPADCPRYVGRVVRDIDPTAATPYWMAERLRRAGLRPISPTVDVTNYVLLELGQPMHAFDLDKIDGEVVVRRAEAEERLTLLTEDEVTVGDRFLLIADQSAPLALGGVMGGLASSVTDRTRHIFFESAYFNPATIVGRARELGLHTDASHRFERGVDPTIQRQAVERATELLVMIAGGTPGPVTEAVSPDHIPERPPVRLRAARIGRLLGTEVPAEQVEKILADLGMRTERNDDGWSVEPPARRFDIAIEEDLIEEVARIYGYDEIPTRPPQGAIPAVSIPEGRFDADRARSLLIDRGYCEAINYSFVSPDQLEPIDSEAFPLANPLSADLSVMRTSLVPGLLSALAYNQNRQRERVRLFEIGAAFPMLDGEVAENARLAAVCAGPVHVEQWASTDRQVDFYDLKGDLEAVLALVGRRFEFRQATRDFLHPGQSADVLLEGTAIGWIGSLHPEWVARVDAEGAVFAFEIDLDAVADVAVPRIEALSRYPSIRRDIAIIVGNGVSWAQIEDSVEETAGNLLTELVVFDEYRGPGIEQGKKSLALGLTLQEKNRTLTDEEVDAVVDSVVARLTDTLGAQLRA